MGAETRRNRSYSDKQLGRWRCLKLALIHSREKASAKVSSQDIAGSWLAGGLGEGWHEYVTNKPRLDAAGPGRIYREPSPALSPFDSRS